MTASQAVKAAGLTGLTQVSQLTGVSLQTLNNWYRTKPQLFRVVLAGCKNVPTGGWWCTHCNHRVSEYQVTYTERHHICGHSVRWVD